MEDSIQDSDGNLCEFTSNIPFVSGCAEDVRIILVSFVSTLLTFERGSWRIQYRILMAVCVCLRLTSLSCRVAHVRITLVSVVSTLLAFERGSWRIQYRILMAVCVSLRLTSLSCRVAHVRITLVSVVSTLLVFGWELKDSIQDADGSLCEITSNIPCMPGCAEDVRITLVYVVPTLLAFERGSWRIQYRILMAVCVSLRLTSLSCRVALRMFE